MEITHLLLKQVLLKKGFNGCEVIDFTDHGGIVSVNFLHFGETTAKCVTMLEICSFIYSEMSSK